MAKESAKKFAENLYTNDEFIKEFYKNGGIKKNATDEEKTELLMKASKAMGYDFTIDEYKEVNGEYFKSLGIWKTIKTFIHLNKVIKSAEKESLKR